VRKVFDQLKKTGAAVVGRMLPTEVTGHEEAWRELLAAHNFRETDQALPHLREFLEGPEHTHVPAHTSRVALDLARTFLAHCPQTQDGKTVFPPRALSDPDRVLTRLDSFISAYASRGMLYEAWFANRPLFELLLLVFDRSEFLAETAIQSPDLIDEIELTGQLHRHKDAPRILAELRLGRDDADQAQWLRNYFRAEQMRIGLRDILELNDFETTFGELTALADACLQFALEVIQRRHCLRQPPFAIIGLGKLGGREINFGSDLDIIFIAPIKSRQLDRWSALAAELMEILSQRTADGMTFKTDARLRPEGRDGLLVNDLAAYEQYYRTRGELWEIQTLSRARLVAGNENTGRAFEALAQKLSNFKNPNLPLAAHTKNWQKIIHEMRQLTEADRTPAGLEELAIKTGAGGLMDAEFIAQTICLAEGWHEPNIFRALERAGKSRLISKKDATSLAENHRALRRLEHILRRWSYEGETLLPENEAAQRRVAIRLGLRDARKLLSEVGKWRKAIRAVYRRFFTP
jgi:glutamate-ammonia-ligase adenylyltransferase